MATISDLCRPLENYIWVAEWARLFSILELVMLWCGKWSWAEN